MIEAEARAYVEAYRERLSGNQEMWRYLVGLLAALDARDAEIARLREVFDRTCKQHSEAMRRTCNAIVPPGADVMERARNCYWEQTAQDGSLVSHTDQRHPIFCVGAIARALQQYGDERAAASKPKAAADVMRRAERACLSAKGVAEVAREMQAYGDERAAAARAAAIEETLAIMKNEGAGRSEAERVGNIYQRVRALAAEPGSQT